MMSLENKKKFLQTIIHAFPKSYEEQSQPNTWRDTTYLFNVLPYTELFHTEGEPEIYGCSFLTEDWLTGSALFQCLTGKSILERLDDIEEPYQNSHLAGYHVEIHLYADTKKLCSATIGLTIYSEQEGHYVDTLVTDIQELQDIFITQTRKILEI